MTEKCEGCGIVAGRALRLEVLSDHREHRLCSWCQNNWEKAETMLGRTVEFEQYRDGIRSGMLENLPRQAVRNEQIRKRAREGETLAGLMDIFNLSESTIRRVLGVK